MTLDDLALKHGTDKGSGGHFYTRHYERMFSAIRLSVESLCEIGVGGGNSLRMWRDWFPHAKIHGVDQNRNDQVEDRIQCFQCEQTDCEQLTKFLRDRFLDVIIDDCSHELSKTISTLDCAWPLLKSGGWYVIEDMCTDSFPETLGKWYSVNSVSIRDLHLFRNEPRSNIIAFIQKA